MDAYDRLAVIDAMAGVVSDWDRPPIDAINAVWFTPAPFIGARPAIAGKG